MSDDPKLPKPSFVDQVKLTYKDGPSPIDADARVSLPPKTVEGLGHAPMGKWQPGFDLPASLVVFLVALPLCLGIALASGVPPIAGLVSGIVGGTVVTLFSRSPLAVSGPAAGLVAVVLVGISELGYDGFLLAVVIAGGMQILFGVLRAGIVAYYFPSAVIKGMLAGIGIILILKQLPHVIGLEATYEDVESFTFALHLPGLGRFHLGSCIIATLGLTVLLVMNRVPKLKKPWMPPPLVVVLLGVGLNALFGVLDPNLALSGPMLVRLPTEGLSGLWADIQAPDFSQWTNQATYTTAFTIAAVASIETLLCIEAIDKLDPYKRSTPTNRELMAQGAGNIVAGLLGGLPITAVIVRGSANVQAGARTRASSFMHGIWLLIAVVAVPFAMNLIPLPALAAVLVFIGYKLAPFALFRDMVTNRPVEVWAPFIVTVVGVLATDLLTGVGLGMLVGVFFILQANLKTPFFIHHQEEHDVLGKKFVKIELSENVSFLNKASVSKVLHELPDDTVVEIDGHATQYFHPDVLELIYDFADTACTRDIEVLLRGIPECDPNEPLH